MSKANEYVIMVDIFLPNGNETIADEHRSVSENVRADHLKDDLVDLTLKIATVVRQLEGK